MRRARWALILMLMLLSGRIVADTATSEPVVIQLKWLHQFQFAGFYVALEQGFFDDEGLLVELRERDMRLNPVQQVLDGEVQYGVTDSAIFQADAQQDLVIVMPIMQHSPNVLLSLRSSQIRHPRDLAGRRIGFYDTEGDGLSILLMLAQHGIEPEVLEPLSWQLRFDSLARGEVDAIAAYTTNELHQLRDLGLAVNILDPRHFGIDLYGDLLFTSRAEAEQHPERVLAVRRAVIRGWHHALNHLEATLDLIEAKYNSQNKSRAALLREARGIEAAIARYHREFGEFDDGRVEFIHELLARYELLGPNGAAFASPEFFQARQSQLVLTEEEQLFLDGLERIRVAVDPDWPPFEYYSRDGELLGISRDYLQLLEQRLGVPFELVPPQSWVRSLEQMEQREIDLIPALSATPERSQYMRFTTPYVRSPMVVVTGLQIDFITSFDQLLDRRVAVVRGYASDEHLSRDYPTANLVRVETALEGLRLVASGEVDAYAGNLAVASHLIQREGLANLKISGSTNYGYHLSIGVRSDWPLLQSIMEKALSSISAREQREIYERWVSLVRATGMHWRQALPFFLVGGVIFLITLLYALHLHRLYHRMQRTNQALAAAQVELADQHQQLEKISMTDKLTGLYNRHYLDQALQEAVQHAQQDRRPLSVVLFDLDDFKQVNDTYGHQYGDQILVHFAQMASSLLRSSDILGRWGGEEFLLICPEIDGAGAFQVAEKVRRFLSQTPHDKLVQRVSAGVCQHQLGDTPDQLLKKVDTQLYQAKAAGRNRVSLAS
ncbi:transporter substrate-binding domain-containing protein [Marinospirillum sp. MEB164]|uniref:diguanylate cyclase n=1 Tax=Marinospirillum alkalitolerans TaxID=3123374 RepID=A0ABW8PVA8_9GAMM